MAKAEVPKPVYKVRLEKNVLIQTRDGTNLASDIYRPDAGGAFPVIAYMGPYHKDLIIEGGSVAGLPEFFAKRGYAFTVVDARGTGGSEGQAPHMFSIKEQKDGYDLVEWLADEAWCDGNVGMFGSSYGFFTSILTAAQNPSHLKAIMVLYGATNWYPSIFEGGNFLGFMFGGYYDPLMIATNALPQYYKDADGRWADVWKRRLEGLIPWIFSWLEHQTDGDFWQQSSINRMYTKVRVPVFAVGGWKDRYPSMPFQLIENLNAPKKVIIGPWTHSRPDTGTPRPQIDHVHEGLRWFDYWLKGLDTGITGEPPITLFVQEYTPPENGTHAQKGSWRFEKEFPVKRGKEVALYLWPGGLLKSEPVKDSSGHEEFEYDPVTGLSSGLFGGVFGVGLPLDQRSDEAFALTWTTPSLSEDMELTGFAKSILFASSSAEVATFVVKLSDVAPDGRSILVTRGSLNATRRDSMENPKSLVPHEVYELKVQLDATSYLFRKGHRMRVAIYGSDFPFLWPTPLKCQNRIYCSSRHPSRILLPIIPQGPLKEKPKLLPPPQPPLVKPHEEELPPWRVIRDFVAKKVEVEWGTPGRKVVATLYPERPEDVSVTGLAQLSSKKGGGSIDVQGKTMIQSDSQAFHVSCSLEIRVDGVTTLTKGWTNSFPRILM